MWAVTRWYWRNRIKFQSPKIGSVVSNLIADAANNALAEKESFNPLKSGQLFQI